MIKIDGKQINNEFKIGQKVWLYSDVESVPPRLVIGIKLTPDGILYVLANGIEASSEHYEIELLDTKPVI